MSKMGNPTEKSEETCKKQRQSAFTANYPF